MGLLKVSMSCKPFFQEFVGQDSSLWEPIHSAPYFHVDKSVFGFPSEVVMVHNIVGEEVQGHPHVFISIKRGFEVHIFDVGACETSTGGADDTVP